MRTFMFCLLMLAAGTAVHAQQSYYNVANVVSIRKGAPMNSQAAFKVQSALDNGEPNDQEIPVGKAIPTYTIVFERYGAKVEGLSISDYKKYKSNQRSRTVHPRQRKIK